MKSYPLHQLTQEFHHLLSQVDQEPLVLTDATEPRYVLLSVQNYQQLLQSLQIMEDQVWGEAAQKALHNSEMVKSEDFVAVLQQILALETAGDQ